MSSGRELSLAHLTVLEATPPELVAVAAAAGFRQVGIRLYATPSVGVPPYDMLGDTPMLRVTQARLAETGVSVLDVEFLRFEPEIAQGIPEGFLEAGARLGARHVLVMSTEPLEARTLERFCELCDRAHQYNLQVCLEFAIYTGVRTLADAARLVKQSARANASVLIDALHFSRSGGSPSHVAGLEPSLFKYAQICDAVAERPRDKTGLIREARAIEAPSRASAGLPLLERASTRTLAVCRRCWWEPAHSGLSERLPLPPQA